MKYYGMSDKGKIRKTNQDSYVIATNEAGDLFAIVCDGIGGNLGGDVASRLAINYFSVAFSVLQSETHILEFQIVKLSFHHLHTVSAEQPHENREYH